MLERTEGNGVRTIIVETAGRFARDLMVQEVGHAKLRKRGIDLIAADLQARQGHMLRSCAVRERRETGKCEGRKSHAERNPEIVALAKRLHRGRSRRAGACRCGRSRPSW